jgi:hypothetical protein
MKYLCIFFLLFPGIISADVPDLEEGEYILDGPVPLEVDRHSTPTVTDWNNDGNKDLVVGQFTNGYIRLFLNQGTDANPVFNGGTLIESSGQPIKTSWS